MSTALIQFPFRLNLHQRRAKWRLETGLPALEGALKGLLADKVIGYERVLNDLGIFYPSRMLYPGEREQMRLEYAKESSDGDPYEVLFRLRIDHYKRMQRLIHFDAKHNSDPTRFIKEYITREADIAKGILTDKYPEDLSEGEWVTRDVTSNRLGVDHERVILLLFELAFNKRLAGEAQAEPFVFSRNAYVDDRALPNPGQSRPPRSREALLTIAKRAGRWPKFVSIWQTYTVATADDTCTWTPHLVDALAMWMSVARDGERSRHSARLLSAASFLKKPSWAKFSFPHDLMR
jgi:hypothetical protein